MLAATGCLFITSAVESVDDAVLERCARGTRARTSSAPSALCRDRRPGAVADVRALHAVDDAATATSICSRRSARLDLVEAVAPIQLAIRLLVTAESALLELPEITAIRWRPFDPTSLTWPWRHRDARVDELQREVMALVSAKAGEPRASVFEAIEALAGAAAACRRHRRRGWLPPYLTEAWYCCAEPGPEQLETL